MKECDYQVQVSFETSIVAATTYLRGIDPVMERVIERIGPCTLRPDPNLFEALVDAIVSQQISVKAADAILARVRAGLPTQCITPETMLPCDYEMLRSFGLSPQKARYIRNLLDHIASGELQLESLPQLDDEEIIMQLVAVKGIGRWTAEMLLIFSLGRMDVLPVDDLGLVEGVRDAYGLPARPTKKEMQAHGELWRPYRTCATWYMWAWRRLAQRNEREKTRIVSL